MGVLLRVLLIAAAVYLVWRLIRGALGMSGGGGGDQFPCATCRNCKNLFDDGVICSFGAKETFKNETHIANCHDYKRA